MKVAELIKILQTHDPKSIVVVPADRADGGSLGLCQGGVRAVNLREILVKSVGFDPDHGAKLFEIDDDGDVLGVEIG